MKATKTAILAMLSAVVAGACALGLSVTTTPVEAHACKFFDDPSHEHCNKDGPSGDPQGEPITCAEAYKTSVDTVHGPACTCEFVRAAEGDNSPELYLLGDCETSEVIVVRNNDVLDGGTPAGAALRGNGFTLTVVDPYGGYFSDESVFEGGASNIFVDQLHIVLESEAADGCEYVDGVPDYDGTLNTVVSYKNQPNGGPMGFASSEVSAGREGASVCDGFVFENVNGTPGSNILGGHTFQRYGVYLKDVNGGPKSNIIHAEDAVAAIYLEDTEGSDIDRNTIVDGQTGILLKDTTDTLIARNVLTTESRGDIGINCGNSGDTTTIRNNNTISGYATPIANCAP